MVQNLAEIFFQNEKEVGVIWGIRRERGLREEILLPGIII